MNVQPLFNFVSYSCFQNIKPSSIGHSFIGVVQAKKEHPKRCSFIGYGDYQCCFAIDFLSIAVKFLFIHLPAEVASVGGLLLVIGRPVYVL